MPVKKYLDIDSTYRNRNLYPDIGKFAVNINQGANKSQFTAVDPITDAYPIQKFSPSLIDNLTFTLVVSTGDPSNPLPIIAESANTTLILTLVATNTYFTNYITKKDYLAGLVLNCNLSTFVILRRIVSSTFLRSTQIDPLSPGTFYFQIIIEEPIPDELLSSTLTFTIYNPTVFSTTTEKSFCFLPASQPIENYYQNYILYNESKGNYASILDFSKTTHVCSLSDISTFNWQLNDVFSLRKKNIAFQNTLTAGLLQIPNSVNLGVTVDPSFVNSFIENNINTINVIPNIKKIVAIIGKDKNGNYTTNIANMVMFTTYVVLENLYEVQFISNDYYFLPFSEDNCNGFNYTGSMVSVTQPTAYEVTLNSITVPNIPLVGGGKVWQLPYLYVMIENISSSSSNSLNILYSNNPNCGKAVFKVPIINISNPESFPFIILNGNAVAQTITIKPNSDMMITVKKPDGTILASLNGDSENGQAPFSWQQMSFLFCFEKI